ncbi:MAG TPA: ABC transporter permease [Thermoanaerobaculia bacterium]|jgi:putative ABC transport system permease protein|nr:ABC transporter permease [Thermoanaerobaculia bacterium]
MIKNYIKLALKVLGRRKFFTFISLFGISLTLVVLMVAVAMMDNLFAPRQPESRFDRVLAVHVVGLYGARGGMTSNPGYRFLKEYMLGLKDAENASIFTTALATAMYHDGRKIETHIRRTDGAYWQILDFRFLEGAPYNEQDNRDAKFVAVITKDMREKLFGAKSRAVGRTIELDGQRFRVVGVVDNVAITRRVGFSEVWAPVRTLKDSSYETLMVGNFGGIVLARSAADFPKLRREFNQRLTTFHFDDPKSFDRIITGLDTGFEAAARNIVGNNVEGNRTAILRTVLIAVALLFVLLPTMNLVSINLSRIMERASEIGVRKAFGASSRTLIAQFVMENIVLTALGGAIGFLLTLIALRVLSAMELVPYLVLDVNFRIFGYGMLLAVAFGIFSGVYPAWRMSRMHPVNALRGGAL